MDAGFDPTNPTVGFAEGHLCTRAVLPWDYSGNDFFILFFCEITSHAEILCSDMEHHFVFVIHVSNSCIQALAFSHSPGAAAIGTV